MRIIAVMSPKGGIGKTTTSDSIAYMLGEEQGKRVLVLDGDPQGDTSKTFGVFEPDGIGMSELLEKHECVGGTYKTGDLIRPTEYSHVDIIPANGYLMKTDMNLLLKSEDNQVTRLREALEEVADAYDYCICDCGRLLDMVVINILISAELVIAPVKVGGYEIEALQNLEEQIEDLRDINPDLRIKALMTMRQKNKTYDYLIKDDIFKYIDEKNKDIKQYEEKQKDSLRYDLEYQKKTIWKFQLVCLIILFFIATFSPDWLFMGHQGDAINVITTFTLIMLYIDKRKEWRY